MFFIYDHTVYVGFAFVGYVFVIRPIEKKAEDLSSDDILLIIKELLENTSEDVHKRFDQLTNKKKEYKKIISGWKKPFQNTIYLFSKEDLKNNTTLTGTKLNSLNMTKTTLQQEWKNNGNRKKNTKNYFQIS